MTQQILSEEFRRMQKLAGIITEGDENFITLAINYNTDQDDLDYIAGILKKAGITSTVTTDKEVKIKINKADKDKLAKVLRKNGFELIESIHRTQKLAGLSEAWQEVDLTGSDGKFEAGDFVTYNEKIYMVTGIYPNGTMGLVLANPKTLDPKTRKDQHLDVKISDVKKYTGKNEDIPVQSESLSEAIEDDGEDGESKVIRKFKFGSGSQDKIELELYSNGYITIQERSDEMTFTKEEVKDLFEILKRILG